MSRSLDGGGGGGVGTRPWWLALLACGGAYWPLAFEPSAMTSRDPHCCGYPHCCGHPPATGWESRMHLLPMASSPDGRISAPVRGHHEDPRLGGAQREGGGGVRKMQAHGVHTQTHTKMPQLCQAPGNQLPHLSSQSTPSTTLPCPVPPTVHGRARIGVERAQENSSHVVFPGADPAKYTAPIWMLAANLGYPPPSS